MPRKRVGVLILGAIVLASIGTFLSYHFVKRSHCISASDGQYAAQFKWGDGTARIQFVKLASGKLSDVPKSVRKQTTDEIAFIVRNARLNVASGSVNLSFQGCESPYLTQFSDWEIPRLSAVMTAAEYWDLPSLKEELANGMNVNAREIGGAQTMLMKAASDPRKVKHFAWERRPDSPDPETIKYLLAIGANPNAADTNGQSALMLSDDTTSGVLIAAGADVNARDKYGMSPLMYAAEFGKSEVIKQELAAGADVNAKDSWGKSALMYAANSGSADSVKLLLAAGADRTAQNKFNQTALAIAKDRSISDPTYRQIVELLDRHDLIPTSKD